MIETGLTVEKRGAKMIFVVPETAEETVYCRVEVGSMEGLDREDLERDLLAANFLWHGAEGGTLGIRNDRIYITDRRTQGFFATNEGVLERYTDALATTVNLWRERLATYRATKEA